MAKPREPISVFLNVPFDAKYEVLFVALVASLVAVGLRPRCVLEIAESGEGRLARLRDLISECQFSIHDLSRVGIPARFNMPFELGLACAAHLSDKDSHRFILMEAKQFRLQQTLSDLNGRDPIIHRSSQIGIINGILETFENADNATDYDSTRRLVRQLQKIRQELSRRRRSSIFARGPFNALTKAALTLAKEGGLRE